jgi:pyruvate/2-oxoglutarate dehydrogenase complex dihydrolipoamide dehydrogenase (E3) component
MTSESPRTWELAIIGGGTAGIVAAKTAAGLGASVVLVERERTGGDCLWTGCVPSKALIAAAHAAASARDAGRLGVNVSGVDVDFGAVMKHVHATIAAIEPTDSVQALEAAGVTVIHGTAQFTGPRTVDIDGRPLSFQRALLATGARPAVPPIPGLADVDHLTSDSLWGLTELPGRLVVLGGGSIGCELGQAFARLGSQVTIVEGAPRVLPREDADASAIVADALRRDGVRLVVGRPVVGAAADGTGGRLLVGDGDGQEAVPFDRLLVALGRSPRTDGLGLDVAGIELDARRFVVVDRGLRTTNNRVWAAGDLTGHPQFTHLAGVHGSLAASNAVLGLRRGVELGAVPRVTFTDPEVAAVGALTGPGDRDAGVDVVTREHDDVDRAQAEADTAGFARLALDRKGRIRGATLVGPRAGESLTELTLAVRGGLRTRDLAGTIHAYPTYGDGPWNAAIEDVRRRLAAPAAARATRALLRMRRAATR